LFAIQDEVAGAIVAALGARIAGDGAPVKVKADTQNLDAYEAYLEANALFLARGTANIRKAIGLFEKVVELDPEFARGWAGLSSVYAISTGWGVSADPAFDRDYPVLGVAAAGKAIALNPELATPYAVLASLETKRTPPDWARAMKHFDGALSKDRSDPNIYNWRALAWEELGFFDRAIADMERCLEIDPAYLNCRGNLVRTLLYAGKEAEARAHEIALARAGKVSHTCGFEIVAIHVRDGDEASVIACLNLFKLLAGETDGDWAIEPMADALMGRTPDRPAALAEFERMMTARGKRASDFSEFPYDFRYLAFRAFDRPPPDTSAIWWSREMDHAPEHKRRLIVERDLPAYWRKHGFPPQCKPVGKDDFECE
jgi:tetratricopeptide (TPR) repeat protein